MDVVRRTYIIIAATAVVRNENGKPFVILVICKMLNAMSTGMKIYFQTEFFFGKFLFRQVPQCFLPAAFGWQVWLCKHSAVCMYKCSP